MSAEPPSAAALSAAFPNFPKRVRWSGAFRRVELEHVGVTGHWVLQLGANSGLVAADAVAVLESEFAATLGIVGIQIDSRGNAARAVEQFGKRPEFAHVQCLFAHDVQIAEAVANSPYASNLKFIAVPNLSENTLLSLQRAHTLRLRGIHAIETANPRAFDQLCHPAFDELVDICAPSPRCKDRGIYEWLGSGRTARIQRLSIASMTSGDGVLGITRLGGLVFAKADWSALKRLNIKNQPFEAAAVRTLLGNSTLLCVEDLQLEGVGARGASLAPLRTSERLSSLRTLDLYRNNLEPEGASHLAASPFLKGLTQLFACGIGDEGAQSLKGASFEKLHSLRLERCSLTDVGAVALSESPWLASVKQLDLTTNKIGEQGAIALAESPYAKNIESLQLFENRVGERGVLALAKLPALRKLSAGSNGFSGAKEKEMIANYSHIAWSLS